MEGASTVKSDLMVKCNTERSWNCSVIIYKDCVVSVRLLVFKLPMSLCMVKLVES